MSQLYNFAREQFAGTELSWVSDTTRVELLSASYNFVATHRYLADVLFSSRLATSAPMVNKGRTDGFCSADPVAFIGLVTTSQIVQYVVYKDTGNAATSVLICQSANVIGWPFTATGADFQLSWSGGNNAVFRI